MIRNILAVIVFCLIIHGAGTANAQNPKPNFFITSPKNNSTFNASNGALGVEFFGEETVESNNIVYATCAPFTVEVQAYEDGMRFYDNEDIDHTYYGPPGYYIWNTSILPPNNNTTIMVLANCVYDSDNGQPQQDGSDYIYINIIYG